jgi:hypothetical protein
VIPALKKLLPHLGQLEKKDLKELLIKMKSKNFRPSQYAPSFKLISL